MNKVSKFSLIFYALFLATGHCFINFVHVFVLRYLWMLPSVFFFNCENYYSEIVNYFFTVSGPEGWTRSWKDKIWRFRRIYRRTIPDGKTSSSIPGLFLYSTTDRLTDHVRYRVLTEILIFKSNHNSKSHPATYYSIIAAAELSMFSNIIQMTKVEHYRQT